MLRLAGKQLVEAAAKSRTWARDNPWRFFLLAAALAGFLWVLIRTIRADNMGLGAKTFWDWLDLLIVPVVLAAGAWWLNHTKKRTEQWIAIDRQHQSTLEAYFDRMTELLVEQGLGQNERNETFPEGRSTNDLATSIARARTLAVLKSLDPTRVGAVLGFIGETKVEEKSLSEIVLLAGGNLRGVEWGGAYLRRANLSGADLTDADLSKAILNQAILSGAKLPWANLSKADLDGAILSGAYLAGADLRGATLIAADLSGAELGPANLGGADLLGADLSGAELWGANLSKANLGSADLSGAELRRANLSKANLGQADLSGANLAWANLSKADLSGAKLSEANLRGAILTGADLSGATLWQIEVSDTREPAIIEKEIERIETDLSGAYLGKADLSGADLTGARYNGDTTWPDGFDPEAAGAVFVEDEGDEEE